MKKRKIEYGAGGGRRAKGTAGAGREPRDTAVSAAATLVEAVAAPLHAPVSAPAAPATLAEAPTGAAIPPAGGIAAPTAPEGQTAPRVARTLRQRAEARGASVELLLFRVGTEIFGIELGSVEEVVDMPELHRVPEMPGSLLGVFALRGSLIPLYAPDAALGAPLRSPASALVFDVGGRRLALAVDDVDDVLTLPLPALRDVPGTDAGDGVLAGVARRGRDLIGVLEVETLLAQLRSGHALETP